MKAPERATQARGARAVLKAIVHPLSALCDALPALLRAPWHVILGAALGGAR